MTFYEIIKFSCYLDSPCEKRALSELNSSNTHAENRGIAIAVDKPWKTKKIHALEPLYLEEKESDGGNKVGPQEH